MKEWRHDSGAPVLINALNTTEDLHERTCEKFGIQKNFVCE